MKKTIVYIAHPYAHPDPVANTHLAIMWAETLLYHGFVPYIPHLNFAWHLVSPKADVFWYDYDINFLLRCDAVLRVGGASKGADNEVSIAKRNKIPVFNYIVKLKEWSESKI